MTLAFLRVWQRNRAQTVQFVLTIALGMGAVSAVVTLMLALGYQALPYRDPGRLVAIWRRTKLSGAVDAISPPDLADYARGAGRAFTSLGGFAVQRLWQVSAGNAQPVTVCSIDEATLRGLGIRPFLGHSALAGDRVPPVAAIAPAWISYRFWQRRYGGSPSAIGSALALGEPSGQNASHFSIVGVFPPGVSIPLPFMTGPTDVWTLMPDLSRRARGASILFAVGRLRPGTSATQAQAALAVVQNNLARRYDFERRELPVVESFETIAQGPARRTMGLLALGVILAFLIAGANLGALMIAEGTRRRREIAIRAALGAGSRRLWVEIGTEKCLLTLVALFAGLGVAFVLLHELARLVPASGLGQPLLRVPALNLEVLLAFGAFALALALLWSARLVASAGGGDSSEVLAAAGSGIGFAGRSDAGPRSGRWRLSILAAQAGVGLCLLAASVLAARVYIAAAQVNLGPSPTRTVLVNFGTSSYAVLKDLPLRVFDRTATERLRRLPGVDSVALSGSFPPGGNLVNFVREGDTAVISRLTTYPISVSRGYFREFGISIVYGRGFTAADRAGTQAVAVISLAMAKANWRTPQQAVDSEVAFGKTFTNPDLIVGVAADFNGYWARGPVPVWYEPEAQSPSYGGTAILRTSDSPAAAMTLARQALRGLATPATVTSVSTIQSRWQATVTRPQARMEGMLLLALLGLGLSLQGVYASASAAVAARGHELAVRAALGADGRRLAWSATGAVVLAVAAGGLSGALASWETMPLLARWLGTAAARAWAPALAAAGLLALAAAAGCFFPARAAARTNPADALREG